MSHPLSDISLGDIITLPGGEESTVRGRVLLRQPAGTMSGFLITGEFDQLLSLPADDRDPVLVYSPLEYLPPEATNAQTVFEGALNFWAAHLPPLQGAMGELTCRVIMVRGRVDPFVLIYRGSYENSELIVFVPSTDYASDDITVRRMRRDVDNQVRMDRHGAVVRAKPLIPNRAPVPEREVEAPAPTR
jgi:hypothetical protein